MRRVPPLPSRAVDAHKGDCGRVLVVAGSNGMLGAAILCATAALRSGAGLVRALLPSALMSPFTIAQPCATTAARSRAALRRELAAHDAVVLGPGLGATAETRGLVDEAMARATCPLVLDADGLNVLAPLRRPFAAAVPLVLTPHPGEAARLLGTTAAAVQRDRGGALRALCARSGAIVVLKGHGTLVGDGARRFHNTTGNAGLATGGSGDVLAGLLGALLAQGMPPFDAACAAVHYHGKAGDVVARRLSQPGLIASDLPLALAEVLA